MRLLEAQQQFPQKIGLTTNTHLITLKHIPSLRENTSGCKSWNPNENKGNLITYSERQKKYVATPSLQSAGKKIKVKFNEFKTEKDYDIVRIYDGNSKSATRLGKFSGNSLPGTVKSTSNNLFIEWVVINLSLPKTKYWLTLQHFLLTDSSRTVQPKKPDGNWLTQWNRYITYHE